MRLKEYAKELNYLLGNVDMYKAICDSIDNEKKDLNKNMKRREVLATAEIEMNWQLSCFSKLYRETFKKYQEKYNKAIIKTDSDKEEFERQSKIYNERRYKL